MMCQEMSELMTDDMEGSLGGARKASFDRHLAACAPCKAYRHQLETTVATLRRLPPEEASAEARARAFAALRTWKRDLM
jgi:hypothetical protein